MQEMALWNLSSIIKKDGHVLVDETDLENQKFTPGIYGLVERNRVPEHDEKFPKNPDVGIIFQKWNASAPRHEVWETRRAKWLEERGEPGREDLWSGRTRGRRGSKAFRIYALRDPEGKEMLYGGRHYRIVAEDSRGRELGSLDYGHGDINAFITHVNVNKKHRGFGVGKRICKVAIQHLRRVLRGKKLPEDVIGTTKTRSRHVKRILEWLKFEPHDYGWLLPLKKGKK